MTPICMTPLVYCACQYPSGTESDGLHLPRTNGRNTSLPLRTPTASANAQRSDAGAYRYHPLDGNRRYGQRHGLTDPHAIYSLGARKLDEVLDWCGQLAIPAVTLWVFSTENFERPTNRSPASWSPSKQKCDHLLMTRGFIAGGSECRRLAS